MQTMNHYSVNLWQEQVREGYPWYDRPADASRQVYAAKEEEAVKECLKALGWSSVCHAEVFDLAERPVHSYHVFDDYPLCLERIGQSDAARSSQQVVETHSRLFDAYTA